MDDADGSAGLSPDWEWLDPSRPPPELVDRATERDRCRAALAALVGGEARGLFVAGDPGLGKSLVVGDAVDAVDTAGWTVGRVACCRFDTEYRLAVALANALRDGDRLSATGHSRAAVRAALSTELDRGPTLLVFDDLTTDAPLGLLDEVAGLDVGPPLATVCVADALAVRNGLSFRARRVVCERELRFARYDRATVRRILADRTRAALSADAVEDGVLDRVARAVGDRYDGDVSSGISLLAHAVESATDCGARVVTPDDVDAARTTLAAERVREVVSGTSVHRALTLGATATATDGETAPRFDDVFAVYERAARAADVDPITDRGVHDHLGALRGDGVVTVTSHRGGSPGHFYRYRLDGASEAVRRALVDALPGSAVEAFGFDE
jgi:cell division control protein 6